MRAILLTVTILLGTISLLAEWEVSEKGHITTDTLIGNKRYVLEENALVVESKYSIKKVDLNTGNIIKEIIFDDTTHSMAVADDNLDKVYLLYDSLVTNYGKYEYQIVDYQTNDTVLIGEKGLPYWDPETESSLKLLNDSLLIISGNIYETHQTFTSKKPFLDLININNIAPLNERVDYQFYLNNYNLWNPRSNSILAVNDYEYSEGNKGGSYTNVKLKLLLLDSLQIYDMKEHKSSSDEFYVPKARFLTFNSSNLNGLFYYDYYYYTQEYEYELMRYDYDKHNVNQLVNSNGEELFTFDYNLGDYVQFTTDDKWLVAIKMNGENSVDFKVFSLEGELIFNDNIPNVNSEQVVCYTDSTYFFESGNKILMYNPFDYNLTNVFEKETDNKIEIYPNPTSQFLNINLPEPSLSSELTIIDQQGNIIESLSLNYEPLQSDQYRLDVSQYPTGLYFVRIRTNNKTSTSKFIKI